MKQILFYIPILLILVLFSCKEEGRIDIIDTSGNAPATIENVVIIPTAGGAVVTYDIPDDDNYFYAKAIYEAPVGIKREAKSSRYDNQLVLEGYGDTESHDVTFVSIGKNTKESEPIILSFNPLTPPVHAILDSLELNAIFGGVEVLFENPTESNIIIDLYMDSTNTGDYSLIYRHYTKAIDGRFTYRGLDPLETSFQVQINDPFGNKSEILDKKLIPLFEQQIPKDRMADLRLPNDCESLRSSNPIQHIWDEIYWTDGSSQFATNFWASDQGIAPMPKWISLDFGYESVLSRLKIWERRGFDEGRTPDKWEVYGSNNPNPDGSWDSWTLIQKFGAPYKPSGLPLGQSTAEDEEVAAAGWDFEFETTSKPYRYYRFKFLSTPNGENFVIISEMTFWGSVQE